MIKPILFTAASLLRMDRWLLDRKRKKNIATILNLHRVSDEPDLFWPPLGRATFRQLLEYAARNYEVCHLSSLKDIPGNRPRLVLSFDDGYLDFFEHALPELRRMGLPSNHNVVIDCVENDTVIWTQQLNQIFSDFRQHSFKGTLPMNDGQISFAGEQTDWKARHDAAYQTLLPMSRQVRMSILQAWKEKMTAEPFPVRMMNWDHVKECLSSGVEIGSHSMTHQTLSSLDPADLVSEIVQSGKILGSKLGVPCKTFSLPNGQFRESTLIAVREAGYERVLLSNDSFFAGPSSAEALLRIPRMMVVEEPEREMKLRIEGFHQLVKRGRL